MRTPACRRGRGLGAPFTATPSSRPGCPLGSLFESVCHWYRWKTVVGGRDRSAPPACPPPALPVPVTKRGLPRRPAFRPVARWRRQVGGVTVPRCGGPFSAPPSDFLFLCGRTGKLSQDPPLSSFRLEISVSSGGTGAGQPWGLVVSCHLGTNVPLF